MQLFSLLGLPSLTVLCTGRYNMCMVKHYLRNSGLTQSFIPVDFIFHLLDGRRASRGGGMAHPDHALNMPLVISGYSFISFHSLAY